MRDIKALHPELQEKYTLFEKECKKQGIFVKYSECVRTVAEQNELYAQGRTKPGSIVTNCTGSSYASMHQWGVAVDFYLDMDVDGDGSKVDDAFNNATGLFDKAGKIAQSVGLEWGGSWTSPVDKPHLQLKQWGSTASQLKAKYGTPDKFMATWKSSTTTSAAGSTTTSKSKYVVVDAESKSKSYTGTYLVETKAVLRAAPGKNKATINTLPKGSTVTCYGYYTQNSSGHIWLFVQFNKYTGYVYLEKCKKI